MTSKNLKIKAGLAAFFVLYFCASGFAETSMYTVRLGEFKTIPAITEFYRLIPGKYHKNTMVCRSGANYQLNCGAYAQEKDIQPLFAQLKEMGLNPQIVKQNFKSESMDCSEADAFFRFAQYPPALSPPAPAPVQQPPYADLSDPAVIRDLENTRTIIPEVTAKILLSNRDVNRIICQGGPIKDIVYSQEKGMTVKTHDRNAFVKFLMTSANLSGGMTYSETPSEIYVICGEDNAVYTLIAEPRNIPAQTIELTSRKKDIQKTLSLFEGLAFERKVILMIRKAFNDDVADSFSVKAVNQPLDIFRDMDVLLGRQIIADGEGLTLNEYILSMKPTSDEGFLPLDEKFFLLPEITQKPVGIALEHMQLTMSRPTRLFIVEKHTD